MRTNKSISLVLLPFLLVGTLCISSYAFSQDKPWKDKPFARLANVTDTSWRVVLTSYDPILSNPQLVCTEPGAEITGFSVSFQPKGKDYIGPFKATGSKLTNNKRVIEVLNELKVSGNEQVNMFIEDIHIKYKGEEIPVKPLIIRIQPHQ